MLGLSTLRSRWTSLVGTIVAVALGAALISGAAELMAGAAGGDGLTRTLTRYAATPIVVQGAQQSADTLEEPPPPPAGSAERLAAVPGVAAAVPDVVIPLRVAGVDEGHGWASARLAGASLVGGSAPADGEAAVGREAGLAPGDTLTVPTADGVHRLRVSGVLDRPGVYVSDRDAARWGTVRAVGILVSDDHEVDAVAAAVRRAAGPSAMVRTGDARHRAEPDPDAVMLDGAIALLAISAGMAGFVAIFVVASTFAFAVSQRRREFALMRLIGAFPRQVRRMVYVEALLAGGLAAALGSLLGIPLASVYAWSLRRADLVPAAFDPSTRFWPLTLGFGIGLAVALLGSWSAARRAGRVPAVEALRDAIVERRPMTLGRWFFGTVFLAGAIALMVAAGAVDSEGAIAMTVFVGELFVVAFALLAPVLIPPVIRLVTWPLAAARGAAPLLVRQGALTAVRRVASTAAPVLVTVGVAGSLIGALATLAHATDTDLRERLRADVVVLPADGPAVDAQVPDAVAKAAPDAVIASTVSTAVWEVPPPGPDGEEGDDHGLTGPALGIVPGELSRTLDVALSAGSLDDLRPGTMTVPADAGMRLGSVATMTFADGRTEPLRVVALVTSLQSGGVLLPLETVRAHDPSARIDTVYVRGGSIDAVRAAVTPLGAAAIDKVTYADSRNQETEEGNQIGLVALLGVALLYTGLAIVNTLLMATFDRRKELALLRLSGTTPRQGLRVVAGEAVLVVLVGVAMAVAATVLSLLGLANALGRSVTNAVPVVPWVPIGVSALVCLVLALGATVVPAWALLRRPPIDLATE